MRRHLFLVCVLMSAVLARAAMAVMHPFSFPDSTDYIELGKAISHGATYVAGGMYAGRLPGYPLFIAACFRTFGDSTTAVLLVQAIVGGGCVWWVYAFCKRLPPAVRVLATVIAAIDPLSIAFSAALLSETVFTFFMLAALTSIQRLGSGLRPKGWSVWWLVLFAAWPAAVYLRASVLWCVVPIAAVHLWQSGRAGRIDWRFGGGILLMLALTFAALVPWWQRNYSLFGTNFFRMSTLDGRFLYESLSPWTTGEPAMEKIQIPDDMKQLNEGQQADEFRSRAWAFARADPWRQVKMAFVKASRTWNPLFNAKDFRSVSLQAMSALWHIPLFALALAGLFLVRRFPWELEIVLCTIMYFTLVHMIYLGSVRYRVPLMPLIGILSACGMFALCARWIQGKRCAGLWV